MKGLILGAAVAVLWMVVVPSRAEARRAEEPSSGAQTGTRTGTNIDSELRRVLDEEYQTELPHERAARPDTAGDVGSGRQQRRRELDPGSLGWRQPESYSVPTGGLGGIAQLLLWMVVGAVVVVAVIWLVQALRQGKSDHAVPAPGDEGAAERAAMVARPLGDAEALAAQGRFGEAIHALLLRTIEELARSLPSGLPSALTSREIVARVPMPERARGALSGLVAAVELCYFGSSVPGAAEYHACRARFQEFAQAYVRGAAA